MSWSSFDSRASPFLTCWRILAYQDPLCQMIHSPWSNLDKTMGSSCTVRKSLVLLKAQQQISAFQGCETEESYSLIRFLVCFFVVVVFLSLATLAKLVASSYLLTREESARVSLQPARERDILVNKGNSRGKIVIETDGISFSSSLFEVAKAGEINIYLKRHFCSSLWFQLWHFLLSLLSNTAMNYRPLSYMAACLLFLCSYVN